MAEKRARWAATVANPTHPLTNHNGYQSLLDRHPDITQHRRMQIVQWVRTCQENAQNWTPKSISS